MKTMASDEVLPPVKSGSLKEQPKKKSDNAAMRLLTSAIAAVPAVKYALGIAGVMAALALGSAFFQSATQALIGAAAMIALMVILLLFAAATDYLRRHGGAVLRLPALVLTWAILILFITSCILLLTTVFLKKPQSYSDFIKQFQAQVLSPASHDVVPAKSAIYIRRDLRNLEALKRQLQLLDGLPYGSGLSSAEIAQRLDTVNTWLLTLRQEDSGGGPPKGGQLTWMSPSEFGDLKRGIPSLNNIPKYLVVECKSFEGHVTSRGIKQFVPCERAQGLRIGFEGEGLRLYRGLVTFAYDISIAIKNEGPKF